ncbi:dephospho-CoA kinase [Magnetovirga frankeli]|uniref:dephospho-CoA kinase n=1 Tax=Magnetovirga frankeli TaxID=947516 RepID=UPI003D338FB1
MAEPLIIGLTGGVAAGKSSVSALFAGLGVPVIDADVLARQLVEPGTPGLAAIIELFGDDFLTHEGRLDRAALRRHIFQNPQRRRQLEALLHPRILAAMQEQARQAPPAPYLLFVIPLLQETGQRDQVDRVLLVDCPEPVQRQRLMRRDGLSAELADALIASQADPDQRRRIADDILANASEADRRQLPHRVEQLHLGYARLAAAEK